MVEWCGDVGEREDEIGSGVVNTFFLEYEDLVSFIHVITWSGRYIPH